MTSYEAIQSIKTHNEIHSRKESNALYITKALQMAVEALEKQIQKRPIHIHEVYHKHDWMLDEDGEIDMWAMESGFHNGPMCQRCYHSECHHCNQDWDNDECIVDDDRCPSCGVKVSRHIKFCTDCGQALDWSDSQQ